MALIDPSVQPVVGDTAVIPLPVTALTESTVTGSGVYDLLMKAARAHLDDEFKLGRIKGPEYATVLLGIITEVMQQAIAFLMTGRKNALEVELLRQQVNNAGLQAKVLVAEECKARAEFDLLSEQRLKTAEEKLLITWKTTTEKAQTTNAGVSPDSVIGRQKALYQKQADGFDRDAEQKLLKILVDTWNVRRTSDDGTVADAVNNLQDATIGRAVNKALTGVGA
jgi:hypothetical protein